MPENQRHRTRQIRSHGWMWLFRFGDKVHLEDFRTRGLLYMKPAYCFSKMEHRYLGCSSERVDRFEGADAIYHPNDWQLTIEGPNGKVEIGADDLADHFAISMNDTDCNVFCMYAVTVPTFVDERNFAFGNSFLFIKNTEEFIRRFRSAAVKDNLLFQYGLVRYYDLTGYSGKTGPFRKPSAFEHQNEFRLTVRPCLPDHRELFLGNLEDITSEILPLAEINRLCDFSPDTARKAGLSW